MDPGIRPLSSVLVSKADQVKQISGSSLKFSRLLASLFNSDPSNIIKISFNKSFSELTTSSGTHVQMITAIAVVLVVTAACIVAVYLYKKRLVFRTPTPSETSDSVLEMKMWKIQNVDDASVIVNPISK